MMNDRQVRIHGVQNCKHAVIPAGVVLPATNISSRAEGESLTQEQALLPKQQQTLCDSEATHHHDTHLRDYLQQERKSSCINVHTAVIV